MPEGTPACEQSEPQSRANFLSEGRWAPTALATSRSWHQGCHRPTSLLSLTLATGSNVQEGGYWGCRAPGPTAGSWGGPQGQGTPQLSALFTLMETSGQRCTPSLPMTKEAPGRQRATAMSLQGGGACYCHIPVFLVTSL